MESSASTRLHLVDVNDYHTWVDNPEKVMNNGHIGFVWAWNWPLDSHPGMWTQGKHIVRWWTEKMEDRDALG